jgi:hypothetical protein
MQSIGLRYICLSGKKKQLKVLKRKKEALINSMNPNWNLYRLNYL